MLSQQNTNCFVTFQLTRRSLPSQRNGESSTARARSHSHRGAQSKHHGGRHHRGRTGDDDDDDDGGVTRGGRPRVSVGKKKERKPRPPRFDLFEVW